MHVRTNDEPFGNEIMNRQERAAYVSRRLDELYPETPIPLRHGDPFTLLVAVVLSAQCTDKKVNQVTPTLFAAARGADEMARLPVEQIQSIIQPLGLAPQKAKAISGFSKILIEQHGGNVPDDFESLEALPGVGHKTASVVMSQAFGHAAFPVDTHIHRLAEKDLKRVLPEAAWGKLHLQIIYYGREHCTARGCDGTVCEICRTCYPRRRKPVVTRKA